MPARSTSHRGGAARVPTVLAALVCALLGAAPAAAAAAPGPPTVVVDPGCTFEEDFAGAWTAPDGTQHVLYSVEGNESFSCGGPRSGQMWHAVRPAGGTWARAPYQGRLMAVTGEATGLYVLFADQQGVWLGRRSPAGTFSVVRHLSPLGLGTRMLPSGALVVRGGRWWAVWSENRDPTAYGTTDLWRARSLGQPAGRPLLRTRVTDSPGHHDDQPHLALRPEGPAFLLWNEVGDQSGAAVVRAGDSLSARTATWTTRLWEDRSPSLSSDVATGPDGVVAVVSGSAGRLYHADDRTGSFRRQQLPAGLRGPALAVTRTRVFVAATADGRSTLVSPPAAGGAWSSVPITTRTVGRTLDVVAQGGRATVYVSDERRLLARSTS